jgi:hypothetical protein
MKFLKGVAKRERRSEMEVKRRKTEDIRVRWVRTLIDLKKAEEEIKKQSDMLKDKLKEQMQVKESLTVDDYTVTRTTSKTPIVSVEKIRKILLEEDVFKVVQVSITLLKKKMGEDEINQIADSFTEKDYISIRKK